MQHKGLNDGCGYGYVWCDTRVIANVISLDNAEKMGKLDTSHEAKQGFVVSNKETGKIAFFDKDKKGWLVASSSDVSNGACLLSAVEENKKTHSKRQVAVVKWLLMTS